MQICFTTNLSYIYDGLLWLKTTLSGTKSMRKQILWPAWRSTNDDKWCVFAVLIAVLYNQHIWQIHNFFWAVYEFSLLSLGRSCKRRGNGWNRHDERRNMFIHFTINWSCLMRNLCLSRVSTAGIFQRGFIDNLMIYLLKYGRKAPNGFKMSLRQMICEF